MVDSLPSKHKALSSISSTTQKSRLSGYSQVIVLSGWDMGSSNHSWPCALLPFPSVNKEPNKNNNSSCTTVLYMHEKSDHISLFLEFSQISQGSKASRRLKFEDIPVCPWLFSDLSCVASHLPAWGRNNGAGMRASL
jgi:hypothetical protein